MTSEKARRALSRFQRIEGMEYSYGVVTHNPGVSRCSACSREIPRREHAIFNPSSSLSIMCGSCAIKHLVKGALCLSS